MKPGDQLLSILVPRDYKGSKNFPSKTVLSTLSVATFASGRKFWAKDSLGRGQKFKSRVIHVKIYLPP